MCAAFETRDTPRTFCLSEESTGHADVARARRKGGIGRWEWEPGEEKGRKREKRYKLLMSEKGFTTICF